jgi:hypothetical protein
VPSGTFPADAVLFSIGMSTNNLNLGFAKRQSSTARARS